MAKSRAMGIDFKTPKNLQKQARFAMSQAVNDALFDARQELVDQVPKSFKKRNAWTEKGFGVTKARKGPAPSGTVGTRREYMVDQVLGGTRTNTAAPSAKLRGSKNRVVRKSRWPRRLRGDGRHFVAKGAEVPKRLRGRLRAGDRYVLRRMGRGGRKLRVQYQLHPSQKVKARFPFELVARKTVHRTMAGHFRRRLKHALKTAR